MQRYQLLETDHRRLETKLGEQQDEFQRLLYRYQQLSSQALRFEQVSTLKVENESLAKQVAELRGQVDQQTTSLEQMRSEESDQKAKFAQLFSQAEQKLVEQFQQLQTTQLELGEARAQLGQSRRLLEQVPRLARTVSELKMCLSDLSRDAERSLAEQSKSQLDQFALILTRFVDLLRQSQRRCFDQSKSWSVPLLEQNFFLISLVFAWFKSIATISARAAANHSTAVARSSQRT